MAITKTNIMAKEKIYYHIIEEGPNPDEIGTQGYEESLEEAEKSIKHLESCFGDVSSYWIFESLSTNEPPIVTV